MSLPLNERLKSPSLSKETITELEAVAWRARKNECSDLEDAATLCLAALQGGYYGKPNTEVSHE